MIDGPKPAMVDVNPGTLRFLIRSAASGVDDLKQGGRSQASAKCRLCWQGGPHSISKVAEDDVTQGELGQVAYKQSVLSQIRLCADRIEELEASQFPTSRDDAERCCLICLPFLNRKHFAAILVLPIEFG